MSFESGLQDEFKDGTLVVFLEKRYLGLFEHKMAVRINLTQLIDPQQKHGTCGSYAAGS